MDSAIQLLKDLIAIPSVSTQETEATEFLVEQSKTLNIDQSYADEAGNFIATRGKGPMHIVMLSHIDTVPGEIDVRIENGKLYGRGSVDAKGSLMSFLWATHLLTEEELEGKRITVVGAVEEEVASSKGAHHFVETNVSTPDFIVIGEPSGWSDITIGYKGGFRFTYHHERELSHYSTGERTAADYGVDFVNELRAIVPSFQATAGERLFEQAQLEIRSLNTKYNGITESVEVRCNLRLPPNYDAQALKDWLQTHYPSTQLEEWIPAHVSGKNNPLIRAFLKSIRAFGGTPRFLKKTGTADFNILGPRWPEIPILAYGPGDSHLDHTPNEHLNLEEYEKAIQILKSVLSLL